MLDKTAIETHRARIEERGYTIVEAALSTECADALTADLERLEGALNIRPSANAFEGAKTVRVYNLLAHGELYEGIPVHENVLPVVEAVLDAGCLVSSLSSIGIDPGEVAQPVHADDQLIPLAKPHAALVCNSMWALSDFTEANGATRIVPGSHRSDHSPDYLSEVDTVAAEMPRGSVMIYHGSLWHGGGANRTDARRLGIAMNYCAGYVRQQENQQLGLAVERVRGFSPRLQELVGYGVYNGLIGHIDKQSPAQRLCKAAAADIIWDRI